MNKKIKILTLGDHPLYPTGVGIQTKNMIESVLASGKFSVVSLAGASRLADTTPQISEEHGEDWKIFPVEGYGNQQVLRSILRTEKPDVLWMMTDPRYWEFLWQIEDEIRPLMPIVYYHVWDNYPTPTFNKRFYDSNDVIVTISNLTKQIVNEVSPDVTTYHVPHSVDTSIYKKISENDIARFRQQHLGQEYDGKTIFFWNNRNTKRKQAASLVWWFKDFLDEVGHDKACLIMHTNPKEPTGPDLEYVTNAAGLDNGQVLLSPAKYEPERMAMLYNMADCTINISDAEGFGLSTLESLACETPIIVTMTGGLQEQVTNGEGEFYGIGIQPASKTIVGSQKVPFIYEDRISKEDFLSSMRTMYALSNEERAALGADGRHHVVNNFSFDNYQEEWVNILLDVNDKCGSWSNRKGYNTWHLMEVK